mmetsp:Transcript_24926/g.42174  ORF Transcript_24926/g.42174 Transcript_24926/m.42174 type:complete len:173 (+) Transcript_24926:131-649(+)|eukprot:CAMPEP_0114426874 /NCGR_PEP_ID=MMETSP0103-20121206/8038_1 /TAXON_ID=37642 ORGANISM="Paraphysomonas imperforata, Strain PA2" /NCGR_SAMPLE_ID=MMETSP0103 /ASSEMBLY_ACC=CAM_ASM_000201 /LENGTH=172 /DNA_ID=CAMNT_0001595879 /DNA_START=126 /DNA_END=644 /DNA_ORIENTATION=+
MGETLSTCVSDGADNTQAPPVKPELEQYRVVGQSGATVRKDINLDSPLVANLEKDTIVDISTIKGRRARIVSPVEGWSSIKTETGYVILKKEGGDMYKYRIVLKEGAVIRKGADIDASEVVGRAEYLDVVESTGEMQEVDGIQRLHIAAGWISMNLRENGTVGASIVERIDN